MTEPVLLAALSAPARTRPGTLAVQLYRDLLAAILAGRIRPGDSLPSSRRAAGALGLSRNTVNTAYDLLRAEGAVTGGAGAAPRVRSLAPPAPAVQGPDVPAQSAPGLSQRGRVCASGRDDGAPGLMAPGQPDPALFPRDAWAAALRRAARAVPDSAMGYRGYDGYEPLRQALARRLAADRGMDLAPGQILIVPGAQSALALVALALADPGQTALIEDPGYTGAQLAFRGAGLRLHPLPVDGEGADPAAAPAAGGFRLIYLTPANQYPLGLRLSRARRTALVDLARRGDAVIIEDDYDSEFLWHGREIAAMQPMAPERVVTIGTLSKALMPGLRLGWIVAPAGLAPRLAAVQRNLGLAANVHAQAALAAVIEDGRYRAQLHRIARIYGERGRGLAARLRALPGVQVDDPSGGVQLAIRLAGGAGAETAARAALVAAGFAPAALSGFCIRARMHGLVSGFAEATPERAARFADVLAQALEGGGGNRPR